MELSFKYLEEKVKDIFQCLEIKYFRKLNNEYQISQYVFAKWFLMNFPLLFKLKSKYFEKSFFGWIASLFIL